MAAQAETLHAPAGVRGLQRASLIPRPIVEEQDRQFSREDLINLRNGAYKRLSEVVSPDGIYASIDPRFGVQKFGRDTFLTAHFISAAYEGRVKDELWYNAKAAVFEFWDFQRDDGKHRHEVRPFDWGILQKAEGFYYKEGKHMVNDDSVDATALALMVTPEFIETKEEFERILPKAVRALDFLMQSMDKKGGWLSYFPNPHGLIHQGWMDSRHGVTLEDGTLPQGPIALVEAQAYAWRTFRQWSDRLQEKIPEISGQLRERADTLKKRFSEVFVMRDEKGEYLAHALDGNGRQIRSISINPGLALWANYTGEPIIDDRYIPSIVARLSAPDFFDPAAGIRTFEEGQQVFDPEDGKPTAYHNGHSVYWPITTAMVAKGMLESGFEREAEKIMYANLVPIGHFDSFVEQFSRNGAYSLFRNGGRDGSCRNQTWTMAETLWIVQQLLRRQEASLAA